jgi:endonuclease YncB( thermonuclease family)
MIQCEVVAVHDGDGPIHCRGGLSIRIAGIQAPDFESAPPCRKHKSGYVCDNGKAAAARDIVWRLTYRTTLNCEWLDVSYARTVARCTLPDGRDLRCTAIALGAADHWPEFEQRYRLAPCPTRQR